MLRLILLWGSYVGRFYTVIDSLSITTRVFSPSNRTALRKRFQILGAKDFLLGVTRGHKQGVSIWQFILGPYPLLSHSRHACLTYRTIDVANCKFADRAFLCAKRFVYSVSMIAYPQNRAPVSVFIQTQVTLKVGKSRNAPKLSIQSNRYYERLRKSQISDQIFGFLDTPEPFLLETPRNFGREKVRNTKIRPNLLFSRTGLTHD